MIGILCQIDIFIDSIDGSCAPHFHDCLKPWPKFVLVSVAVSVIRSLRFDRGTIDFWDLILSQIVFRTSKHPLNHQDNDTNGFFKTRTMSSQFNFY
jgi:hypothetical protein